MFNPAFDVTPADLITGIITERGVFKPSELAGAFRTERRSRIARLCHRKWHRTSKFRAVGF